MARPGELTYAATQNGEVLNQVSNYTVIIPCKVKAVIQGLDKIIETPPLLYTFIIIVFGRLLPSIQTQSFLEWNRTSFEHSLVEFYTILLEEHLQVALQMLEVGICSSL
jgi:hypothetical protein